MEEQFIDKTFSSSSREVIERANAICENYAGQGYDLSLRQLYYQFVSRNWLANTEANYKRLGNIISDARMAGLLDWEYIKDRGRECVENSHWRNPASILDSAARSFRLDLWEDQPIHVEVMVEKQALEGVLQPVCAELDVPFSANKGYSSSSALYEAAQRLSDNSHKELHVLYLGDHDPSGIDMTRDVEERLCLLSREQVQVHRLALNMDQVEQYNPPENPTKLEDSRANAYILRFGMSCWELDALEPAILADLVRDWVLDHQDEDLYEAAKKKQDDWKSELRELAKKFRGEA